MYTDIYFVIDVIKLRVEIKVWSEAGLITTGVQMGDVSALVE